MGLLTRKPPWYAAGLAFECVGCGGCCAGPEEGYVWVTEREIRAIAAHLDLAVAEMERRHVRRVGGRRSLVERKDNRDCVFLQPDGNGGRKCAIYPVRPRQCRTWPFWAVNLRDPGAWALAGMRCPGINRGATYNLEEIERRRRSTHE